MEPIHPGAKLAATVTGVASLSYVPVAIHFDLFAVLVRIAKPATAKEVMAACDESRTEEAKKSSPLCLQLADDILFAMTGIGFVDLVDGGRYVANTMTNYMVVDLPASQHGAVHFTTEVLFAGAFLMKKLKASNFEYPFKEKQTPMQYAYKSIGNEALALEHTYSIMHHEGRMESFDIFMMGKFVKSGKMPERVKGLGYDLDAVIAGAQCPVVLVDIGGGRGEMVLEVKEAYPHLQESSLVLQEMNAQAGSVPGVTVMDWDFKEGGPQPVEGALIYSLANVFHNLPDLDALVLLQKIAKAMAPYSRLLVHEFTKKVGHASLNATMMILYGGRLRSRNEWDKMASMARMKVTFEARPVSGEGLIELQLSAK